MNESQIGATTKESKQSELHKRKESIKWEVMISIGSWIVYWLELDLATVNTLGLMLQGFFWCID